MRSSRGQSVVEFAIILPVIMLVVLGILDFGRAYNYKNDLTSMANQAVRYAETNKCPPGCSNANPLEQYIPSTADSPELQNGNGTGLGIQSPGAQVSFCLPPGSTGAVGDSLRATASAQYRWLPFFGFGVITVSSDAIGRIEVAHTGVPGNDVYATGGAIPPC
jgi:hypothetical protein